MGVSPTCPVVPTRIRAELHAHMIGAICAGLRAWLVLAVPSVLRKHGGAIGRVKLVPMTWANLRWSTSSMLITTLPWCSNCDSRHIIPRLGHTDLDSEPGFVCQTRQEASRLYNASFLKLILLSSALTSMMMVSKPSLSGSVCLGM